MSRERVLPNLLILVGAVGLAMGIWKFGMWILGIGDGQHAPAETVFLGALLFMSGIWALGISSILRPLRRRLQLILCLSLYGGSKLLLLCGLVVALQVVIGAAETVSGALMVASFFVALGVLSLGIGALAHRTAGL